MTDPFENQESSGNAQDLSQFDTENKADKYIVTTDENVIRDMNKRFSGAGKIALALMVLGAGGLAVVYLKNAKAAESQAAALDEINKLQNPDEVPGKLRALLPSVSDPAMRARIILNLGHFRDEASVPLMIEALDSAGVVRRDAAMALAMIGSPKADAAKSKLLAVLPSTDAIDRSDVVWALAVLGETQAADAIIEQFVGGMLQKKPGFEPGVIARVLGIARLGSDALITHKTEGVRVLVAHALSEAGSPETVDPLGKLLTAELGREPSKRSSEVIRAAAAGLGRAGDPRAAQPLFALLQALPDMRNSVFDALSRSSAAPALIALLGQAKDANTRADLVKLISQTRDPRAAETLAKELTNEDADVRFNAAMGLADLGDARAIDALLTFAAAEDNTKADAALVALKQVSRPGVAAPLMAIVKAHPYRKSAVLRALGKSGDAAAEKLLMAELGGDDIGSAALALADLKSEAGYKKLTSMVSRPGNVDMSNPDVKNEIVLANRKAALGGIGRYGKSEAATLLMKIVDDPKDDRRLRSQAAAALGAVATDAQMATVAAHVKDPTTKDDARRYYMEAFYQKPRPGLTSDLLDWVASGSAPEVRIGAGVALGYSADPANDARLTELLGQAASRDAAAVALAMGGGRDAVAKLVARLKTDRDLEEVLRMIMTEDTDTFRVLTENMFSSGSFFRRAAAAQLLRNGDGKTSYAYAWLKLVEAARGGWDGVDGVSKRAVREKLWAALTGPDATTQEVAADILVGMPERGLLLRARDEGGPGAKAAAAALRGQATEE